MDLAERLRTCLSDEPDIAAAYLFGSAARGTATARSDVDVALIFAKDLSPEARLMRLAELNAKLERALGRRVDVVDSEAAHPVLQHQILVDGAVLIERDHNRRVSFEVISRRVYFDMARRFEAWAKARIRAARDVNADGEPTGPSATLEAARRVHQRLAERSGRQLD